MLFGHSVEMWSFLAVVIMFGLWGRHHSNREDLLADIRKMSYQEVFLELLQVPLFGRHREIRDALIKQAGDSVSIHSSVDSVRRVYSLAKKHQVQPAIDNFETKVSRFLNPV